MATQDRPYPSLSQDRPSPLYERRVDPGVNTLRPMRVDPPSKLAPPPPKTPNQTYGKTVR